MISSAESRRGRFDISLVMAQSVVRTIPQKGGRPDDACPVLSQALAALSELRAGKREAVGKLLTELVRR
jgi:hypothetical protein